MAISLQMSAWISWLQIGSWTIMLCLSMGALASRSHTSGPWVRLHVCHLSHWTYCLHSAACCTHGIGPVAVPCAFAFDVLLARVLAVLITSCLFVIVGTYEPLSIFVAKGLLGHCLFTDRVITIR